MKKTEFYRLLQKRDAIENHIWDEWAHRGDLDGTKDWKKNDIVDYCLDYENDVVILKISNDTEVTIPVEDFWHDQDEQPELKMLWHCGYYDHPLNGIAELNGQRVWFEINYDDEEDLSRVSRYALYELSKEELEEECYWHDLFRECVGHHTDYGDAYDRFKGAEEEKFQLFYTRAKEERKTRDYRKNKYLGSFDSCQIDRKRPERQES